MRPPLRLALLVLAASAAAAAAPPPGAGGTPRIVLPFVEDDTPGAMKQAQAKKLPVFVEAWAPW